ncbi:MAG: packaged DNA stabilization protein [Pseudomonadota bacterium]
MQLPLIGGTGVSQNTQRSVNKLNVNVMPKVGVTTTGQGYVSHHPGIVNHKQLSGPSHGSQYNYYTGNEWRASGEKIYKDDEYITSYDGKRTSFSHSKLTQAFIDAGNVKFIDKDGELTELKNWSEGERFSNYGKDTYAVDLYSIDKSYIVIPQWNTEVSSIQFVTDIKTKTSGKDQWILYGKGKFTKEDETKVDAYCGVWFSSDDMAFYYVIDSKDGTKIDDLKVKIQDAVDGEQIVAFSIGEEFAYPIVNISREEDGYKNELSNLLLADLAGIDNRFYTMLLEVDHDDDAPTTKTIKNEYSESSTRAGTMKNGKWVLKKEGSETKSPATDYKFGEIIDVCRNRSRYIALNEDHFIVTSIEPPQESGTGKAGIQEQRPDEIAAFYTAESSQDKNKAVKSWNSYVVVFGRNTTEFFSLTGDVNNIYTSQQGMITQCGTIGTHAVTEYGETFVCIGSPKETELGVFVIAPSQYQMISDSTINDALNRYKESDLESSVVESIVIDNDELIYLHLPNETFMYSTAAKTWTQLKTGYESDKYRGIDIVNNPELGFTIGDTVTSDVGLLDMRVSSQYGDPIEFELYTQYLQIGNGHTPMILGQLSFNAVTGYENFAKNLWISYTSDGVTFGNEVLIPYSEKYNYTNKSLFNNLGLAMGNIGFKVRGQITDGLNISNFTVNGL